MSNPDLTALFVSGLATLATLLAVWVAYLALTRSAEPQVQIYYQPNQDVPSLIDLVIENNGGGSAFDITFSHPIPINCFGIRKAEGESSTVPKSGLPMLSPGQRYTFDGGQFGGLKQKLGDGLKVEASFKYRNPIGIVRKGKERYRIGIEHLGRMPSRQSADQAIVEAIKGQNSSTIRSIRDDIRVISKALQQIAKQGRDAEGT